MSRFWRRKEKTPITASPTAASKTARRSGSSTLTGSDTPLKERLQNTGANKGNELVTLFNIGTTKKLIKGEYLYKEGENADTGYIVLDGAIDETSTSHNHEITVGAYTANTWIAFADFDGNIKRISSAQATESSSVLVLDQRLLTSIDDDVLLFIYRELHKSSVAQTVRKETEKTTLSTQQQNLIDTIFNLRIKVKDRSKNSELAQNVIQKIPKLPLATISLLNKLLDDSTSTNEVVELVKSDPSLTSLLLKNLNSADYNFEEQISDVNHAVALLGFIGVHQIIMSQSLRKSLPATPTFQKVYTRSVEISHIAFAISQISGIGKPAEMATIGLVHDLGNVVTELLRQQNPKLENLIDFFDTAVIGAQLLRTWNLPDPIWQTVEHQDFPEFSQSSKIPEDILSMVAVLFLARLCHQRLNKVSETLLPTFFLSEYLPLLNWDGLSLGNILGEKVIPNLRKKGDALPASLTRLLD